MAMDSQKSTVASHVLQNNHWLLCSVLDAEEMLPDALAKGLLSEEEGKEVEKWLSEQGSGAGVSKMLELLLQSPRKDSFSLLLEVLDEKEELRSWAAYLRNDYDMELEATRMVLEKSEDSPLMKQPSLRKCNFSEPLLQTSPNQLRASENRDKFRKNKTSLPNELSQSPNLQLLTDFKKAQDRSVETINKLLQVYDGQCIYRKVFDMDMKSLLHIACELMDFRVVKMMVEEYNFNPNDQDIEGSTALHIACRARKAQTVMYLLKKPSCDPNMRDREGLTALHVASQKGPESVLKFLFSCSRMDERIKEEVRQLPNGIEMEDVSRMSSTQSNGNLLRKSRDVEVGDDVGKNSKNKKCAEVGETPEVDGSQLQSSDSTVVINPLVESLEREDKTLLESNGGSCKDVADSPSTDMIKATTFDAITKDGKEDLEIELGDSSSCCRCCCSCRTRNSYRAVPKKKKPVISSKLFKLLRTTCIPLLGILLGLVLFAVLAYYLTMKESNNNTS